MAIINSKMKIVKEFTSIASYSVIYINHGLFQFKKYSSNFDGLIGIMDTTGKIIVAPKFTWVYPFREGLSLVNTGDKKNGIIDTLGNWIIPAIYDGLYEYEDGLIRFKSETERWGKHNQNKRWGAMDKTGKIIIQPKYTYLGRCINGYMEYSLTTQPNNIPHGLMTKDEQIIIPDDGKTSIGYWPCSKTDTLVVTAKIGKTKYYDYAVYNLKGKKLFKVKFKELNSQNYGTFRTGNRHSNHGLINSTGVEIAPPQYNVIQTDQYPLMQIENSKNLWGFLDHEGKVIVPCTYSYSHPFKHGLAAVFTGGYLDDFISNPKQKMGYVNLRGELVWPLTR